MKRRILKIALSLLVIVFSIRYSSPYLFKPATVKAVGDLVINFHVPQNDPIFVVKNMLPGDSENRNIDIKNNAQIARMVRLKAVRSSDTGEDPALESILNLIIRENSTPIYGTGSVTGLKTLSQFFAESNTPDWLFLNTINAGDEKTYNFEVSLPSSAENNFQNKSLTFDLIFENLENKSVVINEVFYAVDNTHGSDSPSDKGIKVNGLNLGISGNGTGTVNNIFVDIENNCAIYQVNNLNSNTTINIQQNTGKNNTNGNTGNANISVSSGSASGNIRITNIGNVNKTACGKVKKNKNHEWIELYNPTDSDVNLKNFTITDNSGIAVTITGNKILKKGKFALITKDESTWNFWNEPSNALKIILNKQTGDGLNNAGDRLILKDNMNKEIDRLSWGDDTSGYTPSGINPQVPLGASTNRHAPGFDTNTISDWKAQNPPTPGT